MVVNAFAGIILGPIAIHLRNNHFPLLKRFFIVFLRYNHKE